MAKYQETRGNFIQLPREIFSDKYNLSVNAICLFVWLKELEHRYTNYRDSRFSRTNEQLVKDCGMSEKTLRKARQELIDKGFLTIEKRHYDKKNGQKSEQRITYYRLFR